MNHSRLLFVPAAEFSLFCQRGAQGSKVGTVAAADAVPPFFSIKKKRTRDSFDLYCSGETRRRSNAPARLLSNATRRAGPSPWILTLVFVGEAPLPDGVAGGETLLGDGAVCGDGHGQDPGVGGHAARRRLAAVATDVRTHWWAGGASEHVNR